MKASSFRDYVTDAIKFWEPWRLAYNLVLAAIVIIHFIAGYPASQAVLTLDSALGLFLLAVVANIAYCAAYIADIFAQASGFRELWQRYRWLLFAIGTTFAAVITHSLPWAYSIRPRNIETKRATTPIRRVRELGRSPIETQPRN